MCDPIESLTNEESGEKEGRKEGQRKKRNEIIDGCGVRARVA